MVVVAGGIDDIGCYLAGLVCLLGAAGYARACYGVLANCCSSARASCSSFFASSSGLWASSSKISAYSARRLASSCSLLASSASLLAYLFFASQIWCRIFCRWISTSSYTVEVATLPPYEAAAGPWPWQCTQKPTLGEATTAC